MTRCCWFGGYQHYLGQLSGAHDSILIRLPQDTRQVSKSIQVQLFVEMFFIKQFLQTAGLETTVLISALVKDDNGCADMYGHGQHQVCSCVTRAGHHLMYHCPGTHWVINPRPEQIQTQINLRKQSYGLINISRGV